VEGQKWIIVAAQRGCGEAQDYLARQVMSELAWQAAWMFARSLGDGFSAAPQAQQRDEAEDVESALRTQAFIRSAMGEIDPITEEEIPRSP
jgi:hypothetical protein